MDSTASAAVKTFTDRFGNVDGKVEWMAAAAPDDE